MEACAMSPENEETVSLELRVDEIVPDGVYFGKVFPFLGSTLVYGSDFKILRHNYSANHDYTLMEIRITKELAIYKGLLVRDPTRVGAEFIGEGHIRLDLLVKHQGHQTVTFANPYAKDCSICIWKNEFKIINRTYGTTTISILKSKAIEYGLHKDPEATKPNYIIADLGDGMGNVDLGKSERRFSMASDSKENSGYKTIHGGHTLPLTPFQNAIKEWVKGNAVTGGMGNMDIGKSERRFSATSSPVKDALVDKISSKPLIDNFSDELIKHLTKNNMTDEKYIEYRDSLKPKSREKVNRLRTEFRNFMSGDEK